MDLSSILPNSVVGYAGLVLSVIGAASLFAGTISTLTKNTKDDQIAYWLRRVHDTLAAFAGQSVLKTKRIGTNDYSDQGPELRPAEGQPRPTADGAKAAPPATVAKAKANVKPVVKSKGK